MVCFRLHLEKIWDEVISESDPNRFEPKNERVRYWIEGDPVLEPILSCPLAVIEVPATTKLDDDNGRKITLALSREQAAEVPLIPNTETEVRGLGWGELEESKSVMRVISAENLLLHADRGDYGFKVFERYL